MQLIPTDVDIFKTQIKLIKLYIPLVTEEYEISYMMCIMILI